jgi:hypothetical protein
MTEKAGEKAGDYGSIKVTFDQSRWVVDYGGGITRRFAERNDAVNAAKAAAASEGRAVDLKS